MGRTEEYSVEEVAEALVKARGNKKGAARRLGCGENTIFAYCRRHPELWEVGRLSRSMFVDRAEAALVKLVRAGQWEAIRFVLLTLGRSRGYQLRRRRRLGDPVKRPAYVQTEKKRMEKARAVYGDDQEALTGRSRQAKRRGGRPFLFTPEEVSAALKRAHGIRAQAARLLRCDRKTVYYYCARYPEVMATADDARETFVDEAETMLFEKVDARYWPAIRFVLETLGQDRGYGRDPAPAAPPDEEEKDAEEFWAVVRKVYGDG